MSYRLAPRGVARLADNLLITRDMPEWEDYRAFLHAGNVPEAMPLPAGPSVADVLVEIKTQITAKRDDVQNGGTTIGGLTIRTDPSSLALLGQAFQFSGLRAQRVLKVKTADMQHVDMTAAQISGLFDALGERVALCWDNEAVHYEAINSIASSGDADSTKIAALRAYDFSTGWPD